MNHKKELLRGLRVVTSHLTPAYQLSAREDETVAIADNPIWGLSDN